MPTATLTEAQTFNLETVDLFVRNGDRIILRDGDYVTVASYTKVRGFGDIPMEIAPLHLRPMSDQYCGLNDLPRDLTKPFAFEVMRHMVGFTQDLRLMECRLSGEYELRSRHAPRLWPESDNIAESQAEYIGDCDGCANYFYTRDLRENPDERDGYEQEEWEVHRYCQSCAPDLFRLRTRRSSNVRFFRAENQEPEQTFVRGRRIDRTPYMGFELEVELGQCNYDEIGVKVESAWSAERVKYGGDGSLTHGIEFKTEPHTLEAYQTFDWSVLREIADDGCRSQQTTTCGVHVNISRASFTNLAHEYKFDKFIVTNKRFVEFVAQRRNSRWCSFDGENNSRLISKLKTKQPFGGKYQAVNWCNDDRVEVRVFKGTLIPERLMSYLEFVHSVHAYTKQLTIKDINEHKFAWSRYEMWLRNQPNATYQNIKHYLFERGI